MKDRKPQDEVALGLLTIVIIFVAGSMLALIALAFAGVQGGDNVWAGLFSLCTAALGAVGGYIGGQAIAKSRNGNGGPPDNQPPVA